MSTRLEDLNGIDTDGAELVFGALARMSDVAAHPQIVAEYPALSESLWRAASQQLRNMATLGGNLLQRTRCAYFRGGEPFPCNKRKPGSGCAAQQGIDRGHALLGGSDACIAVYPGDLGDRSCCLRRQDRCTRAGGATHDRGRGTPSRAGTHARPRDGSWARRPDLAHSCAQNRRSAAPRLITKFATGNLMPLRSLPRLSRWKWRATPCVTHASQ